MLKIKEYDDNNELLNVYSITDKSFAYDGCHKIYIIEDNEDKEKAEEYGYTIYPIELLEEKYNDSCELVFISNWKLTKYYIEQFEKAKFEYM